MPLDRLGRVRSQPGEEACRPSASRPIAALVIDPSADARERLCRAGRQAAGDNCRWFEAADAEAARRTLASTEIQLVLADAGGFRPGFPAAAAGVHPVVGYRTEPRRTEPLLVVLSTDDEPQGIQQMLDAGAECCLPKYLPQPILESELRRLVGQARRKAPAA
jgi:DNA-binding NarL/FixJ family response regulator